MAIAGSLRDPRRPSAHVHRQVLETEAARALSQMNYCLQAVKGLWREGREPGETANWYPAEIGLGYVPRVLRRERNVAVSESLPSLLVEGLTQNRRSEVYDPIATVIPERLRDT